MRRCCEPVVAFDRITAPGYFPSMRLLLATRNDHKLAEIRAVLERGGPEGFGIEVDDLRSFPDLPELPETGDTFVHNALQKARFVYEHTGLVALADDSGLEVDALGGAPGVYSKRFSPEATDAANNRLLLEKLAGVADRRARFRCVLAIVGPFGAYTVEGRCEGTIGEEIRGQGGFGYDPLFWPADVAGRTLAELTMAEKNAISHRGRALEHLPALLARR
jgi:XTP/dITP diphosphohydrolase